MTGAAVRRILLTGVTGQVGFELRRTLAVVGEVVALSSRELDLADPDLIRTRVREVKPQLIVNAAAYTAVDRAEQDSARARSVNAIAPGILAEEARRLSAALVHYSTDYVFDGRSARPYREGDPASPLNVYGHTKLAGERAIAQVGVPHLVLRTSWVYGMRGSNFLLTMLRLGRERAELRVVDDQYGAPTWSRLIAEATTAILAQLYAPLGGRESFPAEQGGIFHLSAAGQTTWFGFARAIFGRASLPRSPKLLPIPTAEYPTPARRPAYSVLDNTCVRQAFAVVMPPWEEALSLALTS